MTATPEPPGRPLRGRAGWSHQGGRVRRMTATPTSASGVDTPRPRRPVVRTLGTRKVIAGADRDGTDLQNVPVTRRWFRSLPWDARALDAVEDCALCLTELLTNSILHSDSPVTGSAIEIKAIDTGNAVRVEITDVPSARTLAVFKAAPEPKPLAGSGRGTGIVDAVSSACGYQDAAGERVWWFQIDYPTDAL